MRIAYLPIHGTTMLIEEEVVRALWVDIKKKKLKQKILHLTKLGVGYMSLFRKIMSAHTIKN